jgi:hypothetical protein
VVTNITELPRPEFRDVATIRGRQIDRSGRPVTGVTFEIRSDAFPPWTTTGQARASDGLVEFVVTKGRFAVRVVGGRSQDAGWMQTGQTSAGPMSDFDFTFQTTQ